ncbi:MAG TPA: hypothetical protein VFZ61_11970 [Polyangiales bacterium]
MAEAGATEKCVAQLSESQVASLLAFTERSLAQQRLGAGLWFGGWSAFNAANVGAGAWGIATTSGAEQDTWIMSTVGAAAFLVGASVQPLAGLYGHRRMRRSSAASLAPRSRLMRGLKLLERAAQGEETNSNLTAHLVGWAFAGLSAGYIWLHNLHDDRKGGAIGAAIQLSTTGVAVEAIIWSTPRRARNDLAHLIERYCARLPYAHVRSLRTPLRQRLSTTGTSIRVVF